jgi:uncharacterized integral membrane protein
VKTLFGWIIGLPIAVLAITFAVNNRHSVKADLWPLPFSADLPLYAAVLVPLALGLLLGGIVAWFGAGRVRRQARQERRRARVLEEQVERLRQAPANDPSQPLLLTADRK